MDSIAAAEGNPANVEAFAELLDVVLEVRVVDNVPLGRGEVLLLVPEVVGHVVASDAELEVVLWDPKLRSDSVFVVVSIGREDEHEGGDVSRRHQVRPAVTRWVCCTVR